MTPVDDLISARLSRNVSTLSRQLLQGRNLSQEGAFGMSRASQHRDARRYI